MTKTHLGSIADIITGPFGSALHQYEYVDEGVPVIMPQDIENRNVSYEKIAHITLQKAEELSRYAVIKNDIVYARRGDIEKHAFITSSTNGAICGTGCLRVRVKDTSVNPLFLSYYLDRPETRKWIVSHAVGSNMPNLNTDILSNIPVELPSKEEQDSIVSVLECIEKQIDNNTTICFDLETMAKLLYDYWFVQFDFPDENGKPYKSSGGKMVWNEQLKREIPVRWSVASFGDWIESINTGLNPRDNFVLNTGGTIKYLTVKNLTKEGTIDFSSCDYVDESARTIIHRRSDIQIGDVLFASIAPLGRCYIIMSPPTDWDINESVFSIRPNKENMTSSFLYMSFTNDSFIKKAEGSSTGSVFKGIRIATLQGMQTLLPPKSILDRFDEQVKPLFVRKALAIEENQQLSSLRDFLLPMLMNGQVKIFTESRNG